MSLIGDVVGEGGKYVWLHALDLSIVALDTLTIWECGYVVDG